MVWFQQRRGAMLGRLLVSLSDRGVTPDHVTLLSLASGLAFCPLYGWSMPLALLALAAHVLLDGLDGPLARHQGTDSPKGSLTDTAADQAVVVATTITLMVAETISGAAGAAYIFFYTVVVAFAMIRNALRIPYTWLFRPRFLVFAWLLIEPLWPGTLEYVVWGCNVLLAAKTASGFTRLRARL